MNIHVYYEKNIYYNIIMNLRDIFHEFIKVNI